MIADVRHALRVVARNRAFAISVIGVLALGIGANTALFSVVNAVLLRPLPFEEPERLVRLYTRTPAGVPFDVSPGKFYDWQRDARSFDGMAVYRCCGLRELALIGTGRAQIVRASPVSAGFFDVVRARSALGRVLRPDDDTPAGKYVAVLSDRFWKTALGGRPDVIGQTVRLGETPYTIIGVMPASATVPSWTPMAGDVWVPLALSEEQRANHGNHNLEGVARLKPGVALAEARAEMDAIASRLGGDDPKADRRWGAVVVPMRDAIIGNSRTILLMLLGAAGLVLLIACANVGNLLLTRALNRRREIAIRAALGAPRRRVFQQLLIEALVLATVGGVLGVLVAQAALGAASGLLVDHVPRGTEVSLDSRVLLFALGASLLAGGLAGTLPALRASRSQLSAALNEGGRSIGAIDVGTRRVLITCEVALSVVLLMGSGLMIRSLLALRHSDTGFEPSGVLTMGVNLVEGRYSTPAQRAAFFNAVLERIRAVPGVESAGSIDDVPFVDGSAQPLTRAGAVEGVAGETPVVNVRHVSPGYLRAMRIPVLRGRDVAENDQDALLVSQDAARLVWGSDDPVGQQAILPMMSGAALRQVVGIVGDVKQRDPSEPFTPTVYYYSRERWANRTTLVVRTTLPPKSLERPIVTAIHAIDPEQPVADVRTMEQVIDSRLTSQRFSALLLGCFAAAALVLASLGIYGVLSYIVRGRQREIGIRTALGARTGDILRLVIAEAMSPTLVGIVVGAGVALAGGRVMKSLVFGVSETDPLTLTAVAATLALVALLASLLPAYRASRFDPAIVLRAE